MQHLVAGDADGLQIGQHPVVVTTFFGDVVLEVVGQQRGDLVIR